MTPAQSYPQTSLTNISRAGYARELVWKSEKNYLLKIGSVFATATMLTACCMRSTKPTMNFLGKSVFGPIALVAAVALGVRYYFWSSPARQWVQLYRHLSQGSYDRALEVFESFVDQRKLNDINKDNVWDRTIRNIGYFHPFIKSRFSTAAFWFPKNNTKKLYETGYTSFIDRMMVLDTVILLKKYLSTMNRESKSIEMSFLAGGDWRCSPNQTKWGGDRQWQKKHYEEEIVPSSLPEKIEISREACEKASN